MDYWTHTTNLCWTCADATQQGTDVCRNPPLQVFHTFLDTAFPRAWHGNLLALKAFLLTQDLGHARLVLWVTDVEAIQLHREAFQLLRWGCLSSHPCATHKHKQKTPPHSEFARVIEVHWLWWPELIWNTPIERHPFFSFPRALHAQTASGPYHDVLRLLVLHKYGGTWLDAGALLTQDVGILSARLGLQWQAVWPHSRDFMLTLQRQGALGEAMLRLLGENRGTDEVCLVGCIQGCLYMNMHTQHTLPTHRRVL